MHELKVARVQALTTREMAQIGLFTALIAAGAYIKVNILYMASVESAK